MARIWTYQQYYDDFDRAWDGHVDAASSSQITVTYMDTIGSTSFKGFATGRFTQGVGGEISGTVTGFTFSYKGSLIYSFAGASLSAQRLFDLMESDNPALTAYVLSQSDRFDLSANSDQVRGYRGNDTINGNGGDDRLAGDHGNDLVFGGTGNDTLFGGAGQDRLTGDSGDDVLQGGAGADTLIGGYGADRFVYRLASESTAAAQDQILGFSRSQGDRIDLSAMDADRLAAGNQAFTLIGTASFHHKAGELRFVTKAQGLTLLADTNGDGLAD
jgi:Ca2+-binding RTX toxin-like protein